jgi:hypothetical protein
MRLRTTGQISLVMLLGSGIAAAQPSKAALPFAAAPAPSSVSPPPPAAPAAPPAKPAPPQPAPELAQVAWLLGAWRCDGKAPAGALFPGSPAYDYKSRMTLKKDLKDFVVSVDYEQLKTKVNPLGYRARGFMGYDSLVKKFYVFGVDSSGNWFHEAGEKDGDKLVAEGQGVMGGIKATIRETFTKEGDRAMTWRGEVKPPGAADWQTVGEDNCKR